MIVNTMSVEEMQKEIERDADLLWDRTHRFVDDSRRFFLKTEIFPAYRRLEWNSPKTHTKWIICIFALNRAFRKKTAVLHYALYQSYGLGAVLLRLWDDMTIENITPHFFSRYNERFLKPNGINLSGIDIIEYYMSHNPSSSFDYDEESSRYVSSINDGIVLGEYINGKCLQANTFVSNNMLFKAQIVKDELRRPDLETYNKLVGL